LPNIKKTIDLPMVVPSFLVEKGRSEGRSNVTIKRDGKVEVIATIDRIYEMLID